MESYSNRHGRKWINSDRTRIALEFWARHLDGSAKGEDLQSHQKEVPLLEKVLLLDAQGVGHFQVVRHVFHLQEGQLGFVRTHTHRLDGVQELAQNVAILQRRSEFIREGRAEDLGGEKRGGVDNEDATKIF